MIIFARLNETPTWLIVSVVRPAIKSTLPFGTFEKVIVEPASDPLDGPRLARTMSPVLVPATGAVTVFPAPDAPLHTSLARPCRSVFDP